MDEEGIVVSESVLLQLEAEDKFGHVPGLADSELVGVHELERQVIRAEFEPILSLPVKKQRSWIQPVVEESGGIDWGAFGTVDFERQHPGPDKARYKADRLREKLQDALIMLSIVKERLPGNEKYLVLKYLRMGIIQMEHIVDDNVRAVVKWHLRCRSLRKEIRELEEAIRGRRERELERWSE